MTAALYKFEAYIPLSHVEAVKIAIFAAGAGRFQGYDACSWEVEGVGQFRPLAGSNPFIGTQGAVERVAEIRLETLVKAEFIDAVIAAYKNAHPYEVPAYQVLPCLNFEQDNPLLA